MHSLIVLSVLAGAVHVLAPDHWVPLSLIGWQRRWGSAKTAAIATLAFATHVLLGFVFYLAMEPLLQWVNPARFFAFSVALVFLGTAMRVLRFSQIGNVLRMGSNRLWGTVTVFSLLGPCESVVPIFLKAKFLGVGYVLPFAAFASGTWVAGLVLIAFGSLAWNEPMKLSQLIAWSNRRRTALPFLAGVVAGLLMIFRAG